MENKKAQELSLNTIILVVIGVLVLVIIIVGVTVGWGSIREWISPTSNVNTVVDQCGIACGTQQKYAYCFEKRELKTKEEILKDVTCYGLSVKKAVYGIAGCPAIQCGVEGNFTVAKEKCLTTGENVYYLEGNSGGVNITVCNQDDLDFNALP